MGAHGEDLSPRSRRRKAPDISSRRRPRRTAALSLHRHAASELEASNKMAERVGFEPTIQVVPVYWFSKPAPSASRPPFQNLFRFLMAEEEGFEPSEGVNPLRFSRPPP